MQINETTFIQLPLDGTVNQLEITVQAFQLFPTNITVCWKVAGSTVSKEGILSLPPEIISQWGTDDTIVKNYVLAQLNLTEVLPEPAVSGETTTTTTELI
jgi:hypothetical protein